MVKPIPEPQPAPLRPSVSDTELLEYAPAKVVLKDDFGTELVRRKGRVAKDVDLEF